ncbi:class II myosin [Tilletia horrida]|uniref:Class II myosin n=1 Tax=Tilletia horrida TaxID=155126 RepID=A0AAN6GRL6_9BASI|nr:class II myosin [Tilletia horrida]KAK0553059.1 class II myosin [Tilletia horrida]KAK0569703.1 class II myosin [Tilletia horrida]
MAISRKAGGKKTGGSAAAPPPKKKGGGGVVINGVQKADWKEGFKQKQAGVSDMTLLSKVTNEAINENLQKRFQAALIYTYIGNVLISVNPFRDLGIYTEEILHSYRNKNRLEMTPHVYAIAEGAYYQMNAYHENQCVIISGESGAGKTEAAKRIMQYIAAVSEGGGAEIQDIKDMVLATNPLLESFGCAKTLRNNNSSRHGKYLEIMFNASGAPVGANITNYLLEKNRVVGQIRDERNFHIFYQFAKAASKEQRDAFGIQGPEAYSYIANSRCFDVPGIDDVADFAETIQAMGIIGLSAEEQNSIFRMIAAILFIGNISFSENQEGNAVIADQSVPDFVAYLLEVNSEAVTKALTERIMETQRGGRRGSVYEVPLNPTQSASVRDALAKAIYNNMFEWIVARINKSLNPRSAHANVIGVLDIYGFEIFDNNSFEQLCINYVNEKLQQIFIELTLKKEQEDYAAEQIQWTPIKYFNNKIVCDLIEEKRPPGIFAALNDACATAHADPTAADNSFVQRLSMLSSNPHFETRGSKFLVRHYAGDVMYNVAGVTDKNKDELLKGILDLVDSSSNKYLHTLFPDRPDPNSKKRPPTAGDRIKASANALVENLMRAQPSYIRTIKPNQNKSPTEYDTAAILHQIKYLGLQENIRVRRAGFAWSRPFDKVVERFYLLSPNTSYAGEYTWTGDARTGCERILTDVGIAREEWQMGVTKAFIKNPETLFALEAMRDKYWHRMATRIQRAWRNWILYRHECARRIQRMWMGKKEALVYAALRDYGHQVLQNRKERRRFSLISMRRFMGDYLDVGHSSGGGSAEGEMLRRAAGLGRDETVVFSARVELLVARLGRSSKPSPRFLIMTDRAVYIIITQLVNKQPQTTCERKILLGQISSVGLSELRDDWVLLNVSGSHEEPDPAMHCYFKTEFVARLLQQTHGATNVTISNTLEYTKKKDKKGSIAFKKDETVPRDDVYKSSTVLVPSGEAPGSVSRPPARRKPGVVRPITSGKLIRPGGPQGGRPRPAASTPRAIPKPAQKLPTGAPSAASQVPTNGVSAAGAAARLAARPAAAAAAAATAAVVTNGSAPVRAPPAPPARAAPPAPPAPPAVPMHKALYAYATTNEGEMALVEGELVEVVNKDQDSWWLVKKNGVEGWAPTSYIDPEPQKAPPAPRAAPPAPALPPAKRAVPTPNRNSVIGASGGGGVAALANAMKATNISSPTPTAKPAASTAAAAAVRPSALAADVNAAPVAVMPGMGAPGGFAAILAKKKAEAAAAAAANGGGGGASNGAATPPAVGSKPAAPPKPAGAKPPVLAPKPGAAGKGAPLPPPRRA